MGCRYIRDECGTQSSDGVKLDSKTLCAGFGLKYGFSDFGIYHDAFACMGVGRESDDRKGFVG